MHSVRTHRYRLTQQCKLPTHRYDEDCRKLRKTMQFHATRPLVVASPPSMRAGEQYGGKRKMNTKNQGVVSVARPSRAHQTPGPPSQGPHRRSRLPALPATLPLHHRRASPKSRAASSSKCSARVAGVRGCRNRRTGSWDRPPLNDSAKDSGPSGYGSRRTCTAAVGDVRCSSAAVVKLRLHGCASTHRVRRRSGSRCKRWDRRPLHGSAQDSGVTSHGLRRACTAAVGDLGCQPALAWLRFSPSCRVVWRSSLWRSAEHVQQGRNPLHH